MEYKREVFNAARDGKLYRLKVLLDQKSEEEITLLVSALTDGSTPLVIACNNGHVDVASYLIEECRADIEQVGCVPFDEEAVVEASPLWCAAAAGHLNVVKCLLSHKAFVNAATKTRSTYLLDFAIVGQTCLMVACYRGHYEISKLLIEWGADINIQGEVQQTALLCCIKADSLDLVKLLLQNGARFLPDSSGDSPLIAAALIRHASIVEYIIQGSICSQQEKINALEILGASLLDEDQDVFSALDCWRRAMKLRYEDGDCPLEKPEGGPPIASFMNMTEVRTLSQLEGLIRDPYEISMQALLVRERILGPGHPHNIHYIKRRGEACARGGDFTRGIQLWMYAVTALPRHMHRELLHLMHHFACVMSDAIPFRRGRLVVTFRDILYTYWIALKQIRKTIREGKMLKTFNSNHAVGFLYMALYLIGLMCRKRPEMNKSEESDLKRAVYKLVRLNPVLGNMFTPLHFMCSNPRSSPHLGMFKFRGVCFQLEVINLLLEMGASPLALDICQNSPLHIAAMNKPFSRAVFNSLLNHGAHLDQCNFKGRMPLQLVRGRTSVDINQLQYVNLQCLSAKAINYYQIPYKGIVHKKLEKFVNMH